VEYYNKEMKVIDNFLPKDSFNDLTKLIMDNYFPWYFNFFISSNKEIKEKNCYFNHLIYESGPKSSHFEFIKNKLLSYMDITHLIRVKINCYPRLEKITKHEPHVDYDFSHKGLIFSLNTCDGFTIIGNKKISSVENRALFFDPSKPHCSTNCSNAKARFNININYH